MDHVKECERATNGRDYEVDDHYMHKVLFVAAGTTLAMACLKYVFLIFFIEQWRSRVFLILNLVLLAIFFTSIRSNSSETRENEDNVDMKIQEKKKIKQCSKIKQSSKVHKQCCEFDKWASDAHEPEPKQEQEHIKVDSEAQKLSKEELNERVEAFIAMFRQHLVSDARKGRNQFISTPKQSEMFNLHKRSNLTLSSKRVK